MQNPPGPPGLAAYCRAAAQLLGEDAVAVGDAIAARWQLATLPWSMRPLAILSPASSDAVAPLLALAAQHGVPVHPISRGRNWGLGSRLPPRDAVILDLSRLDRILDLDMETGTVRIEPGVTFHELQARLQREGLAFHLPAFGGPIDASVLANALERGEGIGSLGDRFAHVWDLDVALTSGERFRTGHTRYGNTSLAAVHARPAGPLLEGLFSQSSLGVVLSGRVALQPTLPHGQYILGEIGPPEGLQSVVEAIKQLLHQRVVCAHDLVLWNGAKRASSLPGRHQALATKLRKAPQDWAVSIITSAAHPAQMALTNRLIRLSLGPVTRSFSIQNDRAPDGSRYPTPLTGFSGGQNVMSAYAGKPKPPPKPGNPDLDRCGFMWLCPALPFTTDAILQLDTLLKQAAENRPLFAALGLQPVSARALHGYVSLAWDRDDPAADQAALQAHAELVAAFGVAGFSPYRLGLPTISALPKASDDWPRVLKRLRAALDPTGILSPGRLPGID